MLILDSIKADLKKQHAGEWVPYDPWPGVSFCVSTFSSPAFRHASELAAKRLAKEDMVRDDSELPLETWSARDLKLHRQNGELLAEHILHGWRGIDQEYTPELALERLTDPEYEALSLAVTACARKLARVNARFMEQAEKNSGVPSATG